MILYIKNASFGYASRDISAMFIAYKKVAAILFVASFKKLSETVLTFIEKFFTIFAKRFAYLAYKYYLPG